VTAPLGEPALAAAEFVPGAGPLQAAFGIWLAGALALVAVRLARRARTAARIEPLTPTAEWQRALCASVHLGTLAELETPAVFGLFRPTLLVPRDWLARAPTRCDELALAHERAHVRRGDLWLDELCALVRALLWFHPLVWLATRRIHALCELACDQTVARTLGAEARAYRDTLVLAARPLLASPAPAGLRAFLGHPNAMVVRIERLERLERSVVHPPALVRGASAALLFVLVACVLPMAPRSAALRAEARAVFAAERRGEHQSCFTLQAAALVLAADSTPRSSGD
jgi:beta-lactamase regulating signal transducer with metallopeptidase domain